LKLPDNGLGDIVLNAKHVSQVTLVTFRPEVRPTFRFDQMCRHAHTAIGSLHAALEKMCRSELSPDLAQITRRATLVLLNTNWADDFQFRNLRELGENFTLHTIGKESILFFDGQIFEWQDRDALFCNRARNFSFWRDRDAGQASHIRV
jgi:hypothetical protein